MVEDHGESLVVRLLVPAGEVILVVCHLALALVAGHQHRVLRISLGYFLLHRNSVKIHAERVLFWSGLGYAGGYFPSFYSVFFVEVKSYGYRLVKEVPPCLKILVKSVLCICSSPWSRSSLQYVSGPWVT